MVPELVQGRFHARRLLADYNFSPIAKDATVDSLVSERAEKLKGLFGKVGDGVFIEPPLQVDYGCNISVGKQFYANFNCVMLDCSLITIGDRVMFGPNVSIYTAGHEVDIESRRRGEEFAHEVSIGDDCWIGGGVSFLILNPILLDFMGTR
ncbi:trimeric LpxA-like protein [Atractiella rhizophila]|nr:trimeric LpxA-like protein [Atractiella rhizophila]